MIKPDYRKSVLAVSLLMAMSAYEPLLANHHLSSETVEVVTEQNTEININKKANQDARVKIVINGKTQEFRLPELAEGEETEVKTEAGDTISIKRMDGKHIINLGDREVALPGMHEQQMHGGMMHHGAHDAVTDAVTISAGGLPEDVKLEMAKAVKEVLKSHNIDKKVMLIDKQIDVEIKKELSGDKNQPQKHIMVIKKQVTEKKDN